MGMVSFCLLKEWGGWTGNLAILLHHGEELLLVGPEVLVVQTADGMTEVPRPGTPPVSGLRARSSGKLWEAVGPFAFSLLPSNPLPHRHRKKFDPSRLPRTVSAAQAVRNQAIPTTAAATTTRVARSAVMSYSKRHISGEQVVRCGM